MLQSDSAIERIVGALSAAPDPASLTVEQQRHATEAMASFLPPDSVFERKDVRLGGVQGAWIYTEASRADRVLFFVHGGAFVAGSIDSHLPISVALANIACCRVFAIDYRLAPEAPFPAALEDCSSAFDEISDGPGCSRLAIVADSAGAALALSTLISARDSNRRLSDALVLICPWTDLTCRSDTYESLRDADPILSRDFLTKMASLYLGNKDAASPAVSPQFGDLHGLPPMLIQTGTRDVLHGDALALERKALETGVSCTLEVWQGMIHVWHGFRNQLPESEAALEKIREFLDSVWQ